MRMTFRLLSRSCCWFSASRRRPPQEKTLTVYTYESFTAEWGPGPQVEKAFEAECGCDLKFVSVADGVALLNRREAGGRDDQSRHRARPRHQPDRRSQGDRPVRALRRRYRRTNVPGGWSDDTFVPFDYGYFAVVYDIGEARRSAEEPEGTGRRRSGRRRSSSRIRAPRRRAWACCCGSARSMATRRRKPGQS